MAPTAHSQFSASGAKRGLTCPASFALARIHDDGTRKSSIFSAEGTLAHAISETCLLSGADPHDFVGQTRHADGFDIEITEEFAEAVEVYVNFLRGLKAMGFIILLERRVSPQIHWGGLPPLNIDLFGTSDCIAYHPGMQILVIADLKFGKGVIVETPQNPQLLYYASGSMNEALIKAMIAQHGITPPAGPVPVQEVRTTIIQPRAFHPAGPVRTHSYQPDDIIDWCRTTLYEGVKRAMEDNGKTTVPGDHCRFCPAFASCEAPKKLSFDTAVQMFTGTPISNIPAPSDPNAGLPAHAYTDAEVGEILDKIAIIEPWISVFKEMAKERRKKGRDVVGWSLAPTRATRKWADETDVMLNMLDNMPTLQPDQFSERTLLTPAQVQRKIGKRKYDQIVAPHVVKQSSGMNLVPDGDPRARVRSRSVHEAFNLPAPSHPLKD